MTKYSKFSIYENEMRIFIKALKEQSNIDIEELTGWIYDTGTGVTVYQKAQASFHYPYVAESKKKFGHNPSISFSHVLGQHYNGLVALREALILAFSNNQPDIKEIIISNFNKILLPALSTHTKFIEIEAKIASEFNELLDKDGQLTPMQSLEKVINLFEIKKACYTDLAEDFNNKLTVMREALDEMKKNLPPTAPDAFFKSEKTTELPTSSPVSELN